MRRFFTVEWMSIARKLLILMLAGLLVFYHGYTAYEALTTSRTITVFDYVQIALKCMIVLSLLLVIARRPIGLWGMWVGVIALIGTQYWAHFGFQAVDFTEGRSVFSYLRGLIVPTIVTVAYPKQDV